MTAASIRQAVTAEGTPRRVVTNLNARVVALLAVAVATLLVARTSGPVWVGALALLRVLPPIAGFLPSAGMPLAAPYFLSGQEAAGAHLRPTLVALMVGGGLVGAAGWVALSPLIAWTLFPEAALGIVVFAGVLVLSQMLVSSIKSFCQGDQDLPGSNLVIAVEELSFLPAFALLWLAGVRGGTLIVGSLLMADLATTVFGVARLISKGFLRHWGRVDLVLARRVWLFGLRGEAGSVMLLANLRLDFAIVDVVAGPAALGIYAVASKYAELLRVPSDALLWVTYPRFASGERTAMAAEARRVMLSAGPLVAAGAIPLALLAGFVIPFLYGAAFHAAVVPACILLIGLAAEGVAAVSIAYLYGIGRPGLASTGIGAGMVVTVVLDLLLIPSHGMVGAAIASSLAYLTTTTACVAFFATHSRPARDLERDLEPSGRRQPVSP